MAYDIIIAGGSFAGLAVASQLRGKVLLIEPHQIGGQQTSACGTPLGVPQRLGLTDSVLQVHRELILHARAYTAVVDVSDDPCCTFDYRKFCRGMADAFQADILKACVLGKEGAMVVTHRGRFSAEFLVDASGWRSVLGSQKREFRHRRQLMNFCVETVTRRRGDKLCFWFDPGELPRGIAWFFPIGNGSRVGVANYIADNHLGAPLEDFLESLGLARAETLGGYFPAGLQQAVRENIFFVGDAAGRCLPLTGEGIRPAIYFSQACGSIIQDVLDGQVSLQDGLKAYRSFVAKHRKVYHALRIARGLVAHLPSPLGRFLLLLACRDIFLSYIRPRYMSFAGARGLRPLWPAGREASHAIQAIERAEAA